MRGSGCSAACEQRNGAHAGDLTAQTKVQVVWINRAKGLSAIGTKPSYIASTVNVRLRRNRPFVEPRKPSLQCRGLGTFAIVRNQKASGIKLPLNIPRKALHCYTLMIGRRDRNSPRFNCA